jgi:hypothetical protein
MEKKIHFLKLTGFIPENKRKEFEQTFRFIFNQLPTDCLEHDLSMDINFPGRYHFYSLWPSYNALAVFMKSQEFLVLEGAYEALGTLDKTNHGELVDIKTFQLSDSSL